MIPTVKFMVDRGIPKYKAEIIRVMMEIANNKRRTLENIGAECFGCEVQVIPKGHNQKSPEIEYVNRGDPYKTTVMLINGEFVVGCWGYYVERGNYD